MPLRLFIMVFHLLLFVAPVPLYAVRLDPAVVATLARAVAQNAAQIALYKNNERIFISLVYHYIIKRWRWKGKKLHNFIPRNLLDFRKKLV